MKQMLKRLVAIMIGVAVLFTATPYQHVNAEDGEVVNNPRMTLDSYTTQPGNYAYINLYAYDFVNVMGLEYSIHYDSEVMTLNSYNIGYFVEGSVTNVNDQNVGEIKGSVVNVDGLNGSGQVLGMNFYINQEAQPGTYPITLTIGDAYDMELGTVSIAKESGKLVVNEPSSTVKNISFGCYLNNYNVKYGEKVTCTIQAYDVYQLAAGKFEVEYDSEVLALEDVIIADSLITETAIYTIEDERAGLVQITYADIDPIQDWTQCFTLTFSVIKNENTQTEIKFSADNLLDVNLADLATSTYSNTLNIEEVVYYPTVRIDASNPAEDGTFTADVVFESDTNIAAGDFTVNYNTYEVLCTSVKVNSEVSANGGFVYTKEKIDEGTVFFSYVNTKPVAKEQTILTMTFEPVNEYFGNTVLELKGQDVVNEAYEDITLTYQGANVEVPRQREDIQNLGYYFESYEQYYSGYEIRPYFYFYNGLSEGWDYSLEYSNNINVGTGTLTVTGMNNYKGTITLTFEILPRSINDFYLNLQERYLTYDGTAKFPSVQVDNLVEGRDYTVSYSNNLNVGQGTVTVTGIGNYTGTMSDWFQIQQAYIHEIPMSLEQSEFTYTGNPIEPEVVIEGLTRGKDFEVSYNSNVNVGTASAYVYGIGNYVGEVNLNFEIKPGTIDGKEITLSKTEYIYDGYEKEPRVYIDGLMEGSDYAVSYTNNVDVGTATVIITCYGNYEGTYEVTFTIVPANIADQSIYIMENDFSYDGMAKEPGVSVDRLSQGIDYEVSYKNNVNAGSASVVITGIGNYTGTVEKTFTIRTSDFAGREITLSESTFEYDGTEKEPSVSIEGLEQGVDYEVEYQGNVNVGYAVVTITGIGNYAGTVETRMFEITKANIANKDAGLSATSFEYDGTAKKPVVTIKGLLEGKDFTVSYANNKNAGTATVTITGIGNYTGTVKKTFTITAKTVTVTVDGAIKVCGSADPEFTSKVTGLAGEDTLGITYSRVEGEAVGTYEITATVADNANYAVTVVPGTLTITEAPLPDAALAYETTVYDGSEKKPVVTIKGLTEGTDFTVSYANNKNVGTATVTITGVGNYAGTFTKTFAITAKAVTVTVNDATKVYGSVDPEFTSKVTGLVGEDTLDITYDRVNGEDVGIYKIIATVADNANYTVTVVSGTFTITEASLPDAALEYETTVYDGSEKKPAATIEGLTEGKDFTVSYANNKNAGAATVTITGIGNYAGTVKKTFTITAKAVTVTVDDATKVYGSADPEFTSKVTGLVGEDALGITYDRVEGEAVGTYEITATVADNANYAVTVVPGTLTITEAPLPDAALAYETTVYDGSEKKPVVTIKGLTEGTDFTVSYTNNKNVGKATVTIKGIGNYAGSLEQTFEIEAATIGSFNVVLSETYYVHDGNAKKPSVTIDGLAEGKDFEVSYVNNNVAGTATVVITGLGNYKGTKDVTFNIVSVSEIILDQEKVVLNEGETKQIKVTVVLEDGNTIEDVTWVSLNDGIVSVDNGTITAVSGGITKVQVKAGTKVAELEVTVYCASHTAGEWVVAKEPTVKETGLKVQYCSVCGAVVNEEEIPMLECSHSYSNYISDGNATCMEDGTKTATCDICERETHTIPDEGSKLSHRFVEYVSNKDATYNKNGTETAICANEGCDEEHTREAENSMLKDSVVPSATITIGENSWNALVKPLIYDLFTTAAFDVTVDAVDNESGVESVEYYVAPAELADVTKITEWTTYKAFSIDKEGTYVVYVKVTDKQGNVTYISSNGLVIDRTAPVLEGISDGGSYCDGAVVTVNDMFLGSVLINREEVELFNDGFTLTGAEDGTEFAIEAYDRAGNKTSMTVTVFAGHVFEDYQYNGDKTETAECSRGCGATDTRKIRTGWNLVDGEWYYFDQTGKIVCNKWIADSKGWCYVGEDGRMLYNQWVKDSKGYCFVDASGYMVYNKWVHDGNGWAYAGADGYRQTSKWIKDSVGWCYVGTDGYMVCNDWVADSKDYVYLGESGYMVTNKWIETENGWCYVGSDGYKTTNKWIKKDGNWCYVGADGYLVKNQWVKDSTGWCYLNDEGFMLYNQWVKDSKGWCYVDSSGYMVYNKWVKDDIGWAYAGADGYRVMNKWVKDSIGWCYVDEDGYMLYNQWIADSKGWCFVDGSGYMVYNKWVHDGIGWAYAGKDGYRVMNKWVKDSTGWCYVDENGYMIYNQWVKDSTGYCYVDESGYMVYDQWVEIDGNKYYVNSSGYRVENAWLKIDGNYYYFKEDGSMAKNETIGDYYVDEDGVWIP